MAGRGNILVRGLGAAMVGYGKTLTQQDERQQKQRETDALLLREEALAKFNHTLAIDTVNATAAANVAQHAGTSAIDTGELAARLPMQTAAKVAVVNATQKAEFAKEYALLDKKDRDKLTLEQFIQQKTTERTAMEQEGANSRTAQTNQTTRDTHPIGTFVSADGTPSVAFAPGAATRMVKMQGGHMPSTYNIDERADVAGGNGLGDFRQGGAPGAGRTAAAPAQAAAPRAPDYSTFQQMLAEAAMHPEFKGLPADQVRSRVIDLAKRQGIAAPDQ